MPTLDIVARNRVKALTSAASHLISSRVPIGFGASRLNSSLPSFFFPFVELIRLSLKVAPRLLTLVSLPFVLRVPPCRLHFRFTFHGFLSPYLFRIVPQYHPVPGVVVRLTTGLNASFSPFPRPESDSIPDNVTYIRLHFSPQI